MCPPENPIPWPHAPPHRLTERGTYFVTAATLHKAHHFRGKDRLAVLHRGLLRVAAQYGWNLEAWAVFSNHYHFVAQSPGEAATLPAMLGELHARLAGWLNRLDRCRGRQVWHNFWETQLTHQTSYLARLHYTHQNAVRHGLVAQAREYPWCSARWFEENSPKATVKAIQRFSIDRLHIGDDYDVSPDW